MKSLCCAFSLSFTTHYHLAIRTQQETIQQEIREKTGMCPENCFFCTVLLREILLKMCFLNTKMSLTLDSCWVHLKTQVTWFYVDYFSGVYLVYFISIETLWRLYSAKKLRVFWLAAHFSSQLYNCLANHIKIFCKLFNECTSLLTTHNPWVICK